MDSFNTVPGGEVKPKKNPPILLFAVVILASLLALGVFIYTTSSPTKEFVTPLYEIPEDIDVPGSENFNPEFYDAKIIGIFTAINFSAEEYYSANDQSYKGFCSNMVDEGTVDELSSVTCFDTAATYAISTKLSNENGHYCADSNGVQGVFEVGVSRGDTSCATTH